VVRHRPFDPSRGGDLAGTRRCKQSQTRGTSRWRLPYIAAAVFISLLIGACSTGPPLEGTVWIRNQMASSVNVEIVASTTGWFPSTDDVTITIDGVTGDYCNQTYSFVGPGTVTIRVSGAATAIAQTLSFTEPAPVGGVLQPNSDYMLDINSVGVASLAPGDPPATWTCPGQVTSPP
jgi:hypothetical protein